MPNGRRTAHEIALETRMSCPLYVFIESSGFQWLARDFWTFKFKFSENPGTGRRAYEGGEERLAIDAPRSTVATPQNFWDTLLGQTILQK